MKALREETGRDRLLETTRVVAIFEKFSSLSKDYLSQKTDVMSRITPGSSYTTPGAQRTISSIQQGQRNHPYSNSPSTSAQKYTNRNTLSGGGTVSSASPRALQRQVWVRTFGGREYCFLFESIAIRRWKRYILVYCVVYLF